MPEIIINGPEGRIEARYQPQGERNAPLALILHPHPQYGGTMNNKVVYNLYQTFVNEGFTTLRFNFRGVGKSQGAYSEGIGELCDAATVLDWLQQQNPDSGPCWIAGFSFGAWISLQLLMRRPELDAFVAVSPPANLYDFTFLSPCPASGLILAGDKDDVAPEDAINHFAKKLTHQPGIEVDYSVIHGADHYYRNHMNELQETVRDYIRERMERIYAQRNVRPDKKRRQLPGG